MKALLLSLLSALLVSMPLQAQQSELPLGLDPFPLSSTISQQQRFDPDYRLMLGGIVKINGLIRSDREHRLKAQLTRITWQLPSGYAPEAGFNYLREQLLGKGAEVLFECAGRQCGASNLWANDIFGESRLYGWIAASSMRRLRCLRPTWRFMPCVGGMGVSTFTSICLSRMHQRQPN